MPELPIYDFEGLKEFLRRRGYQIRDGEPIKIHVGDVNIGDYNDGTITITDEGIFLKDRLGVKHQVFLYKKYYHLQKWIPRFHICNCKTIQEFTSMGMRDQYRWAMKEPVPVKDLDNNNEEVEVSGLPLCQNCQSIIRDYGEISSTDFVRILDEMSGANTNPEEIELDIFGYTRDWDDISRQYREEHEYTCEECGLRIDDAYDRQYIHVHHIDGNKLNNQESNLKCLCCYCHAHIDDHHLHRLTTGANRFIYDDFLRKYPR